MGEGEGKGEKEKRMREKERDTPGARSQAASSQPDTRSNESKIYRGKER